MKDIENQVIDLVREIVLMGPGETVNLDDALRGDLDYDSLDIVELVMAAEKKFKVQITDEDTDNLSTVQDLVDHIVQLKAAA